MAFTFIRQQAEKYCTVAKRFSFGIFSPIAGTSMFDVVYVQLDSAVYLFIVYGLTFCLCEPTPLIKYVVKVEKVCKFQHRLVVESVYLNANSKIYDFFQVGRCDFGNSTLLAHADSL